jgi:hypothetical protein
MDELISGRSIGQVGHQGLGPDAKGAALFGDVARGADRGTPVDDHISAGGGQLQGHGAADPGGRAEDGGAGALKLTGTRYHQEIIRGRMIGDQPRIDIPSLTTEGMPDDPSADLQARRRHPAGVVAGINKLGNDRGEAVAVFEQAEVLGRLKFDEPGRRNLLGDPEASVGHTGLVAGAGDDQGGRGDLGQGVGDVVMEHPEHPAGDHVGRGLGREPGHVIEHPERLTAAEAGTSR